MSARWTGDFSFSAVSIAKKDVVFFIATSDEMSDENAAHSAFVLWRAGKWGCSEVGWQSTAVAVCTVPKLQMIAVGELGRAFLMGSGEEHEESISTPDSSPKRRGYLRCVRTIKGKAYIAGMDRQVYRRDGENAYTAIDQGARPGAASTEVTGFEAIDGFSPSEVYAVGWNGEIWCYKGSVWLQAKSPTTEILTDVCCAGDEYVYVCGRQGTLLRGRGNEWEQIAIGDTREDLWSLAWHKGALYAATLKAVYRLRRTKLGIVEFGEDIPSTCCRLSSGDGVLVSAGAKDAMMFDGRSWTRID